MREGFFGLNVAVRGLYAAHKNLDIINHNINNVNTPGYSRQEGVQVASQPMQVWDGTGMIGTGSEVIDVKSTRDNYLDFKNWSESSSFGEWDTKRTQLSELEATFNEPSDSGFTKTLDEFFSAMQELSKDPSSLATRALIREKGVTVAKYFNSVSAHLEKMQSDLNYQVKTKVDEVNALATQVVELNRQIYSSELDGSTANDLRDQRTVLVDKLSKIVNVDANEVVTGKLPNGKDDKHFVINIGGKSLVDHYSLSKLGLTMRTTKQNNEDVDGLYSVGWEDGNQLALRGGELKGLIDIRDGNEGQGTSPGYKGIPYYMRKMNQFVRTFAMAINEGYLDSNNNEKIDPGEDGLGHADGYRLDSKPGDNPSGVRFFTIMGSDDVPVDSKTFIGNATTTTDIFDKYSQLTAKNFAVGQEVMTDINSISVSDQPGEKGNTNAINAILQIRHNSHMFSEGAPEDFMKSLVSTLGIDSQQAIRLSDNQESILKQLDNRRSSVSGVSLDEEMSDMVKYQHAYNAAAKMITTMSEIYDTLINKVGVR